jgi:pSer/pThr/pTyr-binding forkhead associated (FHA) protein
MTFLVGRAPDCFVRPAGEDLDMTVSRRHCAVEIDPDAVYIRDLKSLNGTYVNGEPLRPDDGPRELLDGDWIKVGSCDFLVTIDGGADNDTEFLDAADPAARELAACI